jgi:hypothetical protein
LDKSGHYHHYQEIYLIPCDTYLDFIFLSPNLASLHLQVCNIVIPVRSENLAMMPSHRLLLTAGTALTTVSAQSLPQPVLTLPYTPGLMDATLKHFCLYSRTNSINISYSESRRNDNLCSSCCGTTTSTFINSRSCHQSPFAKSYESTAFGAGCVSAYENAFQGWWLGQWFREIKGGRDTAFGERQPILVNVEGLDCAGIREEDAVAVCGADNPGRSIARGVERMFVLLA